MKTKSNFLLILFLFSFFLHQGLALTCAEYEYLGPSSDVCLRCDISCKTCSSSTKDNCLSCYDGKFLNILSGPSTMGNCLECDPTLRCKTCISLYTCESCYDNYRLSNMNQCEQYCTNSNCIFCSLLLFSTNHELCCPSYNYVTGILNFQCELCDLNCKSCKDYSTFCTSCKNNMILNNGVCACPIGFFLDLATKMFCLKCNENCNECIGSPYCTSCKSNMILSGNSPSTCICGDGKYEDRTDLRPEYCHNCDLNCKNCKTTSTNCISCNSNMILEYVSNTPLTTKCSCGFGKYFDTFFNECRVCSENCLNCYGNTDNCTSCNNGHLLETTNGLGKCICSLSNQYAKTPAICENCNFNCETCKNSDQNCTSCFIGKKWNERNKNGRCCLPNEYIDPAYNCLPCNQSCMSCNLSSKNCSSCFGNLKLNIMNDGSFQCTCLKHQYLNPTSPLCEECDSDCNTCTGFKSNCTSCFSNLTLLNGHCVCTLNQYLDVLLNSCYKCDKSCASCSGPTNSECILCTEGYISQNGKCISLCNSTQYFDKKMEKCYTCNEFCETCDGPSSDQCLSCKTNTYLKNNTCVNNCPSSDYEDKLNKKCISCDTSCLTCSGSTSKSCNSCGNTTFLLNKTCIYFCPAGYLLNPTSQACDLIVTSAIHARITAINNPYTFMLVFYPPPLLNIRFNKYIRQELVLNTSLQIADKRTFNYSITPSEINSSTFILKIDYANNDSLDNTSYMNISFSNNDNPYIEIVNSNVSVSLVEGHECDASSEYFDDSTKSCVKRYRNDFYLSYGDQANVILIKFNDLNEKILSKIRNNLLAITIDGFVHSQDYTYDFSNNSNTISLIFTYRKPVIGDVFLHLSLNQSIFQSLNYQNQTAYIVNHDYSLKLQNYYFLSESQQETINSTSKITSSGSTGSISSMYASMFLSPSSTFAIRGMLLRNIIQLLRYIDISYPPNVVVLFRNDDSRMIFKENMINDQNEKIPAPFTLYGIYCSIVNNSFDEFFQLCLIFSMCFLVYLLLTNQKFWKKNETLKSIEENLKSTFVWNLIVMTLISKYLKASVFVFLFLRYKNDVSGSPLEFFYSLVFLIFVVYFPFHLILIIKNIKKFDFEESANKITPSSNEPGTFHLISPTINIEKNSESLFSPQKASLTSSTKTDYDIQKTKKNSDELVQITSKNSRSSTNQKQKNIDINPQEWEQIPKKNSESPIITKKVNINPLNNILKEDEKNDNNKNNAKLSNETYAYYDVKVLDSQKNTFWRKICFFIKYQSKLIGHSAYRLYNPIDNDEFSFRYRVLLKDFNRTRNINKYYFVIDLLRFFLLCLTITLLYEYPVIQMCVIDAGCFIFYLYLIVFRPFQSKIQMYLCLFNEGLVNTAFLSATILAFMDKNGSLDSDLRMELGWSIAFSYLILMYGLMANTLHAILLLIYMGLKTLLEKLREKNTKNQKKI